MLRGALVTFSRNFSKVPSLIKPTPKTNDLYQTVFHPPIELAPFTGNQSYSGYDAFWGPRCDESGIRTALPVPILNGGFLLARENAGTFTSLP